MRAYRQVENNTTAAPFPTLIDVECGSVDVDIMFPIFTLSSNTFRNCSSKFKERSKTEAGISRSEETFKRGGEFVSTVTNCLMILLE